MLKKYSPISMIHFFDTPHSYLLLLDSEKSQNGMPKNPGTARAEHHGAMACVVIRSGMMATRLTFSCINGLV